MIKPYHWVTLLCLGLALWHLGDIFLWADEGETVFLAHSILQHGIPNITVDGFSLCAYQKATPTGIWIIHPWLQFYITSIFLFFFGTSVFFLRLPFALMGVACVPVLFGLTRRLGLSPRAQIFAASLLAVNVPFLLLIRNVRYYAGSVLCTLLLLFFYLDLRSKKKNAAIFLALTGILFVHLVHFMCFAVVAAIFLHAMLFDRTRRTLQALVWAGLAIFISFLPFGILGWSTIGDYLAARGTLGHGASASDIGLGAFIHIFNLLKYNFPGLLCAPILGFLLLSAFLKFKVNLPKYFVRISTWYARQRLAAPFSRDAFCLVFLVGIAIPLFASALLNQALNPAYVLPCLPMVLILAAVVIDRISGASSWLAILLLLICISSNALALPYWPAAPSGEKESYFFCAKENRLAVLKKNLLNHRLEFFLKNYLVELISNYEGPVEGIVRFLKPQVKPGQTFFASFDHEAIFLFTGLQRIQTMPFPKPPDWIIWRWGSPWSCGTCSADRGWVKEMDEYLVEYLKENNYEEITLALPNQKQENLPIVPDFHAWVTPMVKRPVVIYRHHANLPGHAQTAP